MPVSLWPLHCVSRACGFLRLPLAVWVGFPCECMCEYGFLPTGAGMCAYSVQEQYKHGQGRKEREKLAIRTMRLRQNNAKMSGLAKHVHDHISRRALKDGHFCEDGGSSASTFVEACGE